MQNSSKMKDKALNDILEEDLSESRIYARISKRQYLKFISYLNKISLEKGEKIKISDFLREFIDKLPE